MTEIINGTARRGAPTINRAQLVQRYRQGESMNDIALDLDIAVSVVSSAVNTAARIERVDLGAEHQRARYDIEHRALAEAVSTWRAANPEGTREEALQQIEHRPKMTKALKLLVADVPSAKQQRIEAMARSYLQGKSMLEIGQDFGITRQAVSLLLNRHYPELISSVLATREIDREQAARTEQEREAQRLQDLLARAVALLSQRTSVVTEDELIAELGCTSGDVRWLRTQSLPVSVVHFAQRERTYSDEDVYQALRAVAAVATSSPMSHMEYAALRQDDQPSSVLIINRIGWSAALRAAGLPATKERAHYSNRVSEQDLAHWVQRYLNDVPNGSRSGYERWRAAAHPEAPSASSLRNRFGHWKDTVAVAESFAAQD